MRKVLALSLSLYLPFSLLLSGCSNYNSSHSGGTTTGGGGASATNAQTAIKHIVVIFQENVSFDHYFATYPNAMNPTGETAFTAASGTNTPAGLSGTLLTANPNSTNTLNGTGATNPFRLDIAQAATADQDHNYGPEQGAFDNGLMDLFPYSVGTADTVAEGTSTAAPAIAETTGLTMGYYDGNTVTAMWNYAQNYTMADHFFGTTFGASTQGAINLISGQTNGATPSQNAASVVVSDGGGGYTLVGDADPVGDICSTTTGAAVAMTGPNVGAALTAANITWGFFEGGFDLTVTNSNGTAGCARTTKSAITGTVKADYIPHHQPFQYYASTQNLQHTRPSSIAAIGTNTDGANHQYDTHDFTDALAAGNFPQVSFLKAPGYQDGHAGYSDPIDEQKFVVDIVNAIEQTGYWYDTAIFITYDDSDGWYDHMINIVNGSATPADKLAGAGNCSTATVSATAALAGVNAATLHAQGRCGYGPRLPLILISPWAWKNYVDSTVMDQSSVTQFIEDVFLGSQRLGGGSFDAFAGSPMGMFDFNSNVAPNATPVYLSDTTGAVVTTP
jgi:phospholipase C